mmetsp:Transcript_22812/g.52288  ORF Transcript_22812/g.52288 Transcript_22812/m.52288 type:complete len:85 (+) Transcript_22812:311-565(+)
MKKTVVRGHIDVWWQIRWEYIKINKLQKPGDGRIILCDEKMREVFFPPPIGLSDVNKHIEGHVDGKEIHMLKLQKYLTPHLCEP